MKRNGTENHQIGEIHGDHLESYDRAGARQGRIVELFADIFGLKYEGSSGNFVPVRVNDTLTLDDQNKDSSPTRVA